MSTDSSCFGASMGLLPNTSNCGCACARNAGNVFPVRDARAVMHAGIANSRFPLNSAAGGNVPGIPGACATRDFTYLVRGPCSNPEWNALNRSVHNHNNTQQSTIGVHNSRDHDDVIKWNHFPRYWPFVRGIHPSPVNSPHKGQWRGPLMFSLI